MLQATSAPATPEIICDFHDPALPRVTNVRGILIAGSRAGLNTLGLYQDYVDRLPPLHRDALLYCVASSWIPIDLTLAHFDACDRLELKPAQYDEIGKAVADRMTKTFFTSALRAVRSMGADGQLLWAMSRTDRLMKRIYQGGRCTVVSHGPKELVMELSGIPFASSPYYRGVVLSETRALLGILCRKLFAKLLTPRLPSKESLSIALSWV